jgi:hypothetical protein
LDAAAEPGEGEALDRFPFFSAAIRFVNSDLDTLIILRIASVNLANSGLSGGFTMRTS